jgi:hypothetical protein
MLYMFFIRYNKLFELCSFVFKLKSLCGCEFKSNKLFIYSFIICDHCMYYKKTLFKYKWSLFIIWFIYVLKYQICII